MNTEMKLNQENYQSSYLEFQDRQAGVSLVFDPFKNRYYYNAYCVESKILKELFTVECDFLEEALQTVHLEFGQWELKNHDKKDSGCGSCAAKGNGS